MWVKAIALSAAFVLLGCPGPTFVVQQYAGPQRPPETVATLRINGSEQVRLVTLDGEDVRAPIESDSHLHIELLPGRHWLTIENAAAPNDPLTPAAFTAEAGKFYRPIIVANATRVIEVDRSSDAQGRDVTTTPPAAQPGTPLPAEPAPVVLPPP
jgi:hypothetical protein